MFFVFTELIFICIDLPFIFVFIIFRCQNFIAEVMFCYGSYLLLVLAFNVVCTYVSWACCYPASMSRKQRALVHISTFTVKMSRTVLRATVHFTTSQS